MGKQAMHKELLLAQERNNDLEKRYTKALGQVLALQLQLNDARRAASTATFKVQDLEAAQTLLKNQLECEHQQASTRIAQLSADLSASKQQLSVMQGRLSGLQDAAEKAHLELKSMCEAAESAERLKQRLTSERDQFKCYIDHLSDDLRALQNRKGQHNIDTVRCQVMTRVLK
jgi:chromosome segregation ATPase